MASFLTERFALCEPPFTRTGIDWFGSFSVKRWRVIKKRWGCILTCPTTSAVHLEVAADLSTDSLMALKWFPERRGKPKTICSDNGTNCVGVNWDLGKALKPLSQEQITGELAWQGITWYFNLLSYPHMGGRFESMGRLVNRALKTVTNYQTLPKEELPTVLVKHRLLFIVDPLFSSD